MRVAIIDLNNNTPNQGIRAIRELLEQAPEVTYIDIFDVRAKMEIPDLSYDLYISSGGPGDPMDGDGIWDANYFKWLDAMVAYNLENEDKKYVFLICHSFQMACRHFGVGQISKRRKKSFGTFPIRKSNEGLTEPILAELPDPFYAADFRDFQVTNPDLSDMAAKGYRIIALEHEEIAQGYPRALMGIKFSDEIMAFQFHPEADSKGMVMHFQDETRRAYIIDNYGQEKYDTMISDLKAPDKIKLTHSQIIPKFIRYAAGQLKAEFTLV